MSTDVASALSYQTLFDSWWQTIFVSTMATKCDLRLVDSWYQSSCRPCLDVHSSPVLGWLVISIIMSSVLRSPISTCAWLTCDNSFHLSSLPWSPNRIRSHEGKREICFPDFWSSVVKQISINSASKSWMLMSRSLVCDALMKHLECRGPSTARWEEAGEEGELENT